MILAFAGLAATNPATNIGTFAIFAVIAALGVGDAGRRGRRLADRRRRRADAGRTALVGLPVRLSHRLNRRRRAGAGAGRADELVAGLSADGRADRADGAGRAPARRTPSGPTLASSTRNWPSRARSSRSARWIALAIVGVSWVWAIFSIARFMVSMLTTAPGVKQPSVADFTKHYGPWIIFATVIVPLIVAAVTNWLRNEAPLRADRAGHASHAGRGPRSTIFTSRWSLRSASLRRGSAGAC